MNYRKLISQLSTRKEYDHYVLAKCNFVCGMQHDIPMSDNSVIATDHKYFSVLDYTMGKEDSYASIRMTILRPTQNIANQTPGPSTIPVTKAKDVRFFRPEDIDSFVHDVGDSNPIHQVRIPVVPGLQLLEEVLLTFGCIGQNRDMVCPATVSMSFHQPLFANEPYILHSSKKTIMNSGAAASQSDYSGGSSVSEEISFSGNAVDADLTYFTGIVQISYDEGGRHDS